MIVDTNALSAWRKGDADLLPVLTSRGSLSITVISVGEYQAGLLDSSQRPEGERWLRDVLARVSLLPVTLATSFHYATVRSEQKAIGRPIPANDLWIAALARQHRLPVLSRDTHFDLVAGVRRIGW